MTTEDKHKLAKAFGLNPSGEGASNVETPWAIRCPTHGLVYLTEAEYNSQMRRPDSLWVCPQVGCGAEAQWDDATYDNAMAKREAQETME